METSGCEAREKRFSPDAKHYYGHRVRLTEVANISWATSRCFPESQLLSCLATLSQKNMALYAFMPQAVQVILC